MTNDFPRVLIDPAKFYQADMTAETAFGAIRFGETRPGTDPACHGLPWTWLEAPATDAELLIHAGQRQEAAAAASQRTAADRSAAEAVHGPLHLTKAEGGQRAV